MFDINAKLSMINFTIRSTQLYAFQGENNISPYSSFNNFHYTHPKVEQKLLGNQIHWRIYYESER